MSTAIHGPEAPAIFPTSPIIQGDVTENGHVFDPAPYTTKATIDGEQADTINVKFGGKWEPSPETFDSLKLGRTVTLTIEAEVVGKASGLKRDENGDPIVTGEARLNVIDVYASPDETL